MVNNLFNNVAAVCAAKDPGFFNFPTWYQYLNPKVSNGICTVDFVWPSSLPLVALAIVDILLRIAALVAVGFVIVGGIKYVTSQGDPQSAANARETIIGALAGLAIATIAAALVSFIGTRLGV
jgi:hypothetical protein